MAWFAAALVALLIGWNNLLVVRLPGYPASYLPGNLAGTGLVLAAARLVGLSWAELGLARDHLRDGARWGLAGAALVGGAYALAFAVPVTRPLLADDRVAGLDAGAVAYHAALRIPVGTVLWEEVAFRGVLLAALARLLPAPVAALGAAAVFGVWHVRPTLAAVRANDLAEAAWSPGLLVLLGCLLTAVAGLVLTWLRLRSHSLLAPCLLHAAANSLGLVAAHVATPSG